MTHPAHKLDRPARHLRLLADDDPTPPARTDRDQRELPALVVAAVGLGGLAVGLVPWLLVIARGGLAGVYLGTAGMLGSALLAIRGMTHLAPRPTRRPRSREGRR